MDLHQNPRLHHYWTQLPNCTRSFTILAARLELPTNGERHSMTRYPLRGVHSSVSGLHSTRQVCAVYPVFVLLLNELSGYEQRAPLPSTSNEDPSVAVPLSLDRLRAATAVFRDLLQYALPLLNAIVCAQRMFSASTTRPVTLPIGPVVRFCLALLQCNGEDKVG